MPKKRSRRRGPTDEQPPGWDTLFAAWTAANFRRTGSGVARARFVEIPLLRSGLLRTQQAFDWVAVDEAADVARDAAQRGFYGFSIEHGPAHTASLLWEARSDAELTAAVWIAASAWHHSQARGRPLVASWSGTVYPLFSLTMVAMRTGKLAGYEFWHHASTRALPWSVTDVDMVHMVQPQTVEDVVKLAMVEATMSQALYVPVRLIQTEVG